MTPQASGLSPRGNRGTRHSPTTLVDHFSFHPHSLLSMIPLKRKASEDQPVIQSKRRHVTRAPTLSNIAQWAFNWIISKSAGRIIPPDTKPCLCVLFINLTPTLIVLAGGWIHQQIASTQSNCPLPLADPRSSIGSGLCHHKSPTITEPFHCALQVEIIHAPLPAVPRRAHLV